MPGDEETQHLRFHLLGPVRAERRGQPLVLGPPQQRAALAVLLLRGGRPIGTAELVEALWGPAPPVHAADTLCSYVARLRTTLDLPVVATDTECAVRVPAECVDAAVFAERLAAAATAKADGDVAGAHALLTAALDLWEGDTALTGLPGPYAERERRRLDEARATAREDLLECALALGQHAGAIADLRALVTEHPARERSRALLMLALHRAGRQAEALAVFADAQRVLAEQCGTQPGAELVSLHERVLTDDPSLGVPAAGPARPAGGGTTRDTTRGAAEGLPPRPADFSGRRDLVEAAVAAVRAGGLVVLEGANGVGRTAIALQAAHALRDAFPGGRHFFGLRGGSDRPLDPSTALTCLLRELGVRDGALPEGTERQAALLRSLATGRPLLLVLDDARDAAQVEQMLPGCAVIVTAATGEVELPDARRLTVDVPEEKEALALLSAVSGAVGTGAAARAAQSVVTACGRLPLALRIAGARLAGREFSTLADLADRLREEAGAGEPVEAAFRVGYEALGAECARALRLTTVADVPAYDGATVAAAADLPGGAKHGDAVAGELVAAGLWERAGRGTYRCHALVREHARRLSERTDGEEAREAALRRVVAHWSSSPGAAGPFPGVWGGGLVPAAVALLGVWSERLAGTAAHDVLRRPAEEALARAAEAGDGAGVAGALRVLAVPRCGADTLDRCERLLRAAVRWAEAAGDADGRLAAGRDLGGVLLAMGRGEEAVPLLEPAAAAGCPRALADLGLAQAVAGRMDRALKTADEAVARTADDPQAYVLRQAGRTWLRAGRSTTAADRLRDAVNAASSPREEALTSAYLAHCRLDQRRHREGVEAADHALSLEAGLGDAYCRGLALFARGRGLLSLGESRIAAGCLREAREVLGRRGAGEAADVEGLLREEFG
ncbi:regulatory protein AfsR [Streptomyces mashuensis]|uniref:Regulatory protein AfsR n=1 Tax=Streptomyces mashuensis TaxID=33904 RepID=A0A919B3P1_9ACTN|nr:BTAD domain-containing putative transcriptional regulator [Streptomyces mashuensis]GHF42097.1 regulatory protein AfsR [Streptomyces mashuensis]